ncbi:MAG: ATP-grasp domain-containing protein [Rhodopseudomonas sp.]|uniref:ATP-binding protein n=1 Tax=Rhodopseudomonas sp. TaxID=1078 RepID=UPI0018356837|nr:ATP-grasp domain-containing protein [Rhodopseudomonas sp.]NVN88486.1 ATP-grasp domain-containing protein [Rhodopseudomonas sp.]
MRDPPPIRRPLRVLLSEGGSTSAREAITVLGLAGHHVEICDPSPFCLGRFSRFVTKFHRCPGIGADPAGYLAFIERLLREHRFDVVLPIHEQGLLFAKVQGRMARRAGIALPEFANYRIALDKVRFSRLLDELGLPQPRTRIVDSAQALRDAVEFPCVVKSAIGTASRGVWLLRDATGLNEAVRELTDADAFAEEVLVQEFVEGAVEHAQAVLAHGQLLGLHGYRQIAAGAGGGDAIKQSVQRADVRAHIAAIGARLCWHGGLSFDYIQPDDGAPPLYIDCNPRLVEPMSATLAGIDLMDLLLRVSLRETELVAADGRAGVRSHLAMQALLGCALRGGSRRALLQECFSLTSRRGPYAGSVEELTPARLDWISAVPLIVTAAMLLAAPRVAPRLARKGWGDHLLSPRSIRTIEQDDFG